jgi:predicted acetyltransferase
MKIELRPVSRDKKKVVARLMQFYLYDFSEIEGIDIRPNGSFRVRNLNSYWEEPDRFAFFICVEGNLGGFVLVNSFCCVYSDSDARSIAEFFILQKYRRQGVGRAAAYQVFDMFPGKWEVRQIAQNLAGRQFWRHVIGDYTGGDFKEVLLDNESWKGPAQIFDNRTKNHSRKV